MSFKACIKKDFFEIFRTKRWYILLAAALGCTLLSTLVIVAFNVLNSSGVDMSAITEGLGEDLGNLFTTSYASSFMYFAAYITTYFAVIMVVFFGQCFSKEIKDKKWITPLSCGVKSEDMVASKTLINFVGMIAILVFSSAVHLCLTVILCPSFEMTVLDLLYSYLFLIIFEMFMFILTISLNAITKKTWVSITFPILVMILLPEIFSMFKVGGSEFTNFTPFLFYKIAMSTGNLSSFLSHEYIWAGISTLVIVGALLFMSLSFNKIKAEK